mgnify:CR=1 FL=1
MQKNKRNLMLACLLYLTGCTTLPTAQAMTTETIGYGGKDIFAVYYYGAEDKENTAARNFFAQLGKEPLCYTLTDDLKHGLGQAFLQWAEIIGPGVKNTVPVQYFVGTFSDVNAMATAVSYDNTGTYTENPHYLHMALQNGTAIKWLTGIETLPDDSLPLGIGKIIIGKNLGVDKGDGRYSLVAYGKPIPLAQAMTDVDIVSVMYHELGHSLGISADKRRYFESERNVDGVEIFSFGDAVKNSSSFTAHLYDQNGQQAGVKVIVPPAVKNKLQNDAALAGFFGNNYILQDADAFVVDNAVAFTGRNGRAFATFRGEHVTEALAGKTFTGAYGEQITGIPVNNRWEGSSPDLSHIELARSLMSHQNYRSYNSFMEAELAIMQDIGYKIDRRNFYGRSIYNDGVTLTNTQGFSARNSEGTAYIDGYNTATYGVGLHIYGSHNNITQAGNIYAAGPGAVGIRVDGLNDTITVAKGSEVHGDGTYGAGILTAYGKNHVLNVDGTVTATGKNGNAIWLEFGANSLGANTEYRGSYMRYKRSVENGVITKSYNVGLKDFEHALDDFSITDLENGDLNDKMATVNVSGTLTGSGNAIYIGEEAFVDNININAGAQINGAITSNWRNFTADSGITATDSVTAETSANGNTVYVGGLVLQYDGKLIPYNKYVPDLVTNLNFNADMRYGGAITGSNNMKMKVNAGTLVYGGKADVVSVQVAKEAALIGGSYKLNDQSGNIYTGYSDDTTGKLLNHGTIGPRSGNDNMQIEGSLVSDGILQGDATGLAGKIEVTGSANIDGSAAELRNALPGERKEILTAQSVSGKAVNETVPRHVSGMLDNIAAVTGNSVAVTAVSANNLGSINDQQAETYEAMQKMYKGLSAERREEMRILYNLDVPAAKSALQAIGSSGAPQMMSMVQQSTIAGQVIGDRLSTAFATAPVKVALPASRLSDDEGENTGGVEVPVNLPVAAENNVWVKFTKHWGDMQGGANYHGQAISGGWDRSVGKNFRAGLFISYNAMSYGQDSVHGNSYDTRAGIYGGYHNGSHDAYIYLDYGVQRNRLYRSVPRGQAQARYDSHLLELGGEYKYDLHAEDGRIWHVSPYAGLQLSYLRQPGFNESGAGINNHKVDAQQNTYFAMQLGCEFKRYLGKGSYSLRAGVKHAFCGADPYLSFHYEGDAENAYTLRNHQDKTHLLLSLSADTEFTPGWQLSGDVLMQKGRHDKDISAAVMLRRMW